MNASLPCRLSMCVRLVNGKRGMFRVPITFLCRSLAPGWENSILRKPRRFIAAAVIAPASPRAFRSSRVSMSFGMFPAVGKPGKRRSCQLKKWTANERSNGATPAFIRGDDAHGCLVDPTAARIYRIVDFHRLFHVGGFSGKKLFLRQLRLAVLFARTVWQFAP